MGCIEIGPIYDVYYISLCQYQFYLDILFGDVSVSQLVALMSCVVLGIAVEVVRSKLTRGEIFTALTGSVGLLYPSVFILCIKLHQFLILCIT